VTNDVPLRFGVRLAWLVVLVAAVAANASDRAVAIPLVLPATAAWLAWTTARRTDVEVAAIVVLAAAGATLTVWTPIALGFVAMAGIAAGASFDVRRAALVALAGPAALVVAFAAAGWSTPRVVGGMAAALAGLVGGVARRQAREREAQLARAHLAREQHDVLAHTLAALAVQLEAAEAVLDAGDEAKLRALLERSRSLVASGIEETAQAVRTLRDGPVEIADRLARLVADDAIPLRVEGTPRPLPAGAGLALYRAAQEALTNVRKHAPGAATEVSLTFGDRVTVLRVANAASASGDRAPGARLGLQGMRERLELAGGRLEVDDGGGGFVVEATVPE
jgi:signal transduction histidine kinase